MGISKHCIYPSAAHTKGVTSIGKYVFGNCNKLTTVTSHIQEPIARNTNVRSRPIPVGGFVVFSVIMGSTEPPFCPNAAAPEILPHTKLHEGLVCRISYPVGRKKNLQPPGLQVSVELERFELSSKRGTNLLSTCLSSPSIVGIKQDRSHPLNPYPLKTSPETRGSFQTISDIPAPPYRNASEQQHPGDVSSPQLLQRLSYDLLFFDQAARA